MIITNIPNSTSISALNAKVDIQTKSTLVTCTCGDSLQEFVLHREGDSSKFFGFGISHKLDIVFIDLDRKLKEAPVEKGNTIKIALGRGDNFDYPYPTMYITELSRNEKTSNVTCVAYDALFKANIHKVSELNIDLEASALNWPKLAEIGERCAEILGLSGLELVGLDTNNTYEFNSFVHKANLDGSESLKELLDDIAEFTQTIYYINNQNKLTFKQLDKEGNPVLTVDKNMYFELTTLTPRTITGVCHATELGNNFTTEDDSGVIQIMRNNAFYEDYAGDREDTLQLALNNAAYRVSGLTFTQLECEWDGNHCLEIGDKVAFVTEDDSNAIIYIINDAIEYRGFLNEITSWEYTQDEEETDANPTSIGDIISQTYSKVDKVNKEITLMVNDVAEAKSLASELQVKTGEISATVSSLETKTNDKLEVVNKDVETLAKEVTLKVDSDAVSIVVSQALSEGVDRVVTASKHYTFDDDGLEISSSDSEIKTLITEDGMTIYKNNSEVLVADNQGVKATDLHARTYLIIGENSRLEDKGNRTACFWIGPAGG